MKSINSKTSEIKLICFAMALAVLLMLIALPAFAQWDPNAFFKGQNRILQVDFGQNISEGVILSTFWKGEPGFYLSLFANRTVYKTVKVSQRVFAGLLGDFHRKYYHPQYRKRVPLYCPQSLKVYISDGWHYKKTDSLCLTAVDKSGHIALATWYRRVRKLVR